MQEIINTIGLIKKRLEFEQYFSSDYISLKPETQDKSEAAERLLKQVKDCRMCPLCETRKNVVFGDGSLDAKIMFVGEAPGRDEDLAGKPFVGAAGQLLTKIIKAMGFERREVYISNVLRCRPPGNRNPNPEEVACCRPYLLKLIDIIKPKVICPLGKFAAQSLLEVTLPISRLRGNFYEFNDIKVMPTFHPAYLLRNPQDKKLVWEDMKKILKVLKK